MQHPRHENIDRFLRILKSSQSLSSILLDYQICPHCQHVRKMLPNASGSCPACKKEISVGRGFAPLVISSLIDLIQDHYRMELSYTSVTGERIVKPKEARHHVGIILLFCTFVESWMGRFLWSLMVARRLPEPVIDRLLSDNWRFSDRKGKLFKSLTGEAFGDAIQNVTQENSCKGGDLDYGMIWDTVTSVFKVRNELIHTGAISKLCEDVVSNCLYSIHGVNQLYIALHNRYIAQESGI